MSSTFKTDLNKVKKTILELVYSAQSGHIGGSFSIAGITTYLYKNYGINKIQSDGKLFPHSDILIMSKGHAVPAMYACEYLFKKTISHSELLTFREIDSKLQGHPDKNRFPEMVASTGSLGQGLSIAIGHALAKKRQELHGNVFCIVGDGEMQEGQIYEAMMFAGHYKLNNLCMILDKNLAQNDGSLVMCPTIKDLAPAFGWKFATSNKFEDEAEFGRILNVVGARQNNFPLIFELFTTKGAGVKFMENPEWHAKAPNKEEFAKAMEELNESN